MPEKSKHQLPDRVKPKRSSTRRRQSAEPEDLGIYQREDNNATILKYAVPVLAETVGANNASFRGLIGKVGSLSRSATVFENQTDRILYDVFIERSLDINNQGRKIGRVTLQIVISRYHALDESEVIAEWSLIEEVGAADDLLTDAAMLHVPSTSAADEVDLNDPLLNVEMAQGQAESLSELEEDDEETAVVVLFGTEINRYAEKKLRLTTGIKPSLTYYAGYETDEASYALKLDDGFSTKLIGDTPAELAVMAQLNKETFVMIDSEIMQEVVEALEVVGILKRSNRKKSPALEYRHDKY